MPESVRITDVSPRDGLQNEPGVIPTADKVRLVELLCATGVDEVEVTSFVSPKWVPQLGDAAEVFQGLRTLLPPPSGRGQGVGGVDSDEIRTTPNRFQPPARNPETLRRAQALRKAATGPERALWEMLRNIEAMGVKFRRQHPFGPYILDFFSQDCLLAVEVDGRTHADELAQRHDAQRDRYLESFGIKVLRFSNDAVIASPSGVARRVREEVLLRPRLGTRKPLPVGLGVQTLSEPTPQPPPSGRGRRPVFSTLVPNEKGLDSALAINASVPSLIDKVSVFTAASETFSRKNTNATIAETLQRFTPVIERAHGAGLRVRGYVSCAIACPFEGPIAPSAVARVCADLAELGVDEIDVGDTIGAGTPATIAEMLQAVGKELENRTGQIGLDDSEMFTLHLHDTFGRASECVRAALDLGVRSFDGSAGGLGGCPYASTPGKRAPGNISTATLVRTIESAGYSTGVDLDRLAEASEWAMKMVGR